MYSQAEVSKRALRIGQQTDGTVLFMMWVKLSKSAHSLGEGADDELSVIYLGESNEVTHPGPHSQGSRGTSLKKGLRDLHLKAAAHKQEDEWTRSNVPLNKSIFSVCTFKEAALWNGIQALGPDHWVEFQHHHFFTSVCPWAHHYSMPPCSHL